jgi:hypothetical protein
VQYMRVESTLFGTLVDTEAWETGDAD